MVAKLKVRPIVPTKGHDDDVCFCYFVFDDDASPGINLYFNITAKHSGLHLDMINNDPPLRSHSRKHSTGNACSGNHGGKTGRYACMCLADKENFFLIPALSSFAFVPLHRAGVLQAALILLQ